MLIQPLLHLKVVKTFGKLTNFFCMEKVPLTNQNNKLSLNFSMLSQKFSPGILIEIISDNYS